MSVDYHVFDSLVDVVFILNVEADEKFKFIYVNTSFLTTTGLNKNQVLQKYVQDVIPEPSLTGVLKKYRTAISERRMQKWDEVTEYPTGTKYGEVTVVPVFDEKGQCTSLVGNVHDVTELILARKKAEDALVVRSRFLDIAAHELRNPVASIYLMLQVMEKQIERNIPIENEKILELLHPAARLNRLVADLLDLSRLEKDVMTLNLKTHDLHHCIHHWIKELRLLFKDRKINFFALDEKVEMKFDALRIFQVFTNLVENAVKYSAIPNQIDVKLENFKDHVKVSVIDHGEGIPDEMLKSIFDPFSRGGLDIKVRHTGLGLGLPISVRIVRLHGGDIQVESKHGQGSTFSFTLPKAGIP